MSQPWSMYTLTLVVVLACWCAAVQGQQVFTLSVQGNPGPFTAGTNPSIDVLVTNTTDGSAITDAVTLEASASGTDALTLTTTSASAVTQGLYTLTLSQATVAGEYTLSVNIAGVNTGVTVDGDVTFTVVAAEPQCKASTATHLVGVITDVHSFRVNNLRLTTYDVFGNEAIATADLPVSLEFSQALLPAIDPDSVTQRAASVDGDGKLVLSFALRASGTVSLRLRCLDVNQLTDETQAAAYQLDFSGDPACFPLNFCSGVGACIDAACQCPEGYTGNACDESAPAPMPLAATFARDKSLLVRVTFDRATNRAGGAGVRFACDAVLAVTTVGLLGSGAECFWEDSLTLAVFLGMGSDATLVPPTGTLIISGSGALASADGTTALLTDTAITLSDDPLAATTPQLRVVGPTKVASCAPLRLDASGTLHSFGRAFTWTWSVLAAPAPVTPAITAATATIGATTGASLFVPGGDFPQGTWSIRVTASNGVAASSADVTVVKMAQGVVTSSVDAPLDFVVRSDSALLLRGQADVSCVEDTEATSTESLEYAWFPTSSAAFIGVPSGDLSNTQNLFLASSSLQTDTDYVLGFGSSLGSGDLAFSLANAADLSLHVPLRIEPFIAPGGVLHAARNVPIVLDARSSVDASTSLAQLSVSWTCVTVSFFGVSRPCFEPAVHAILFTGPNVNPLMPRIPPALLLAGAYSFTVSIAPSNGGAPARTASLRVETTTVEVPALTIVGPPGGVANVDQQLVLHAATTSPFDAEITFAWSIEPGIDEADASLFATPLTNEDLEINAGTLVPGITYTVTLAATDSLGTTSVTQRITANEPPLGGSLAVESAADAGRPNRIRATAAGWEDDALPLYYWFHVLTDDGDMVPLTTYPLISATAAFSVPDSAHTLVVLVSDALGSASRASVSLSPVSEGGDPSARLATAVRLGRIEDILLALRDEASFLNDPPVAVAGAPTEDQLRERRESALRLLSEFPVELTLESYAVVVDVLRLLTAVPDELTDTSRDLVLAVVNRWLDATATRAPGSGWSATRATAVTRSFTSLASLFSPTAAWTSAERQAQAATVWEGTLARIAHHALLDRAVGVEAQTFASELMQVEARKGKPDLLPLAVSSDTAAFTLAREAVLKAAGGQGAIEMVFTAYAGQPHSYSDASANVASGAGGLSALTLQDASDGSALRTSDLGEGAVMITFQNDNAGSVNVTEDVLVDPAQCVFWNDDAQAWSESGCSLVSASFVPDASGGVAGGVSVAPEAQCVCDHLTQFALLQSVSTVVPVGPGPETVVDLGDPVAAPVSDSPWWLIAMVAALGVLGLIVFAVVRRKNLRHRRGVEVTPDLDQRPVHRMWPDVEQQTSPLDLPVNVPHRAPMSLYAGSESPFISEDDSSKSEHVAQVEQMHRSLAKKDE